MPVYWKHERDKMIARADDLSSRQSHGLLPKVAGFAVGGFFAKALFNAANRNVNIASADKLIYLKHTAQSATLSAAMQDRDKWNLGTGLWNFAASLQERVKMGDIRLFKSLHIRSIASMLALKDSEVTLSRMHAFSLKAYLEKIAGRTIDDAELASGLLYKSGKILSVATGKTIVSHAIAFEGSWIDPVTKKVAKTSLNVLSHATVGVVPSEANVPFMFIGGKNRLQTYARMANMGFTDMMRNYMALLDNPFELLGKVLHSKTFGESGEKLFNKIGLLNKFGVGGRDFLLNRSGLQLLARHAIHGAPRLFLAFEGFKVLNEMLDLPGTPLEGGITGMLARAYQGITLAGSYVSKVTGLTSVAKSQEQAYPGSTSLLGLAAIPASFALTGALASGILNIGEQFGGEAAHPLLRDGGYNAKWYKSMISAMDESDSIIARIGKKLFTAESGRTKVWATAGAIIGSLLVAPFIPGAIGSKKDPEELKKIYSGEELVPIKKNRFWELGTGLFEGEKTKYFAPHWTVRAIKKPTQKGIYGDDYGHPIRRFLKWIQDPYYLEKEHDKDRPYAVWGPSEPPLGPIGVIWRHTIGKILKPPVIAHPDALRATMDEYQDKNTPRALRDLPESISGGDKAVPATIGAADKKLSTPYDKKVAAENLIDSLLEAGGLRGYILSHLKKESGIGENPTESGPIIESSGRITSSNRTYWEREIGGAGGLNEFYRRLNRRRKYTDEYLQANIQNNMPSWIPEELHKGDPYASIPMGEVRLPGEGFATLYPELKDLSPDEYPAVYRYKILQDVAPHSPERYKYEALSDSLAARGDLTPREMDILNEIKREQEYRKENDDQLVKPSKQDIVGKYWDTLRNVAHRNPFEALTPVSPAHKFLPYADITTRLRDEILDTKIKHWYSPYKSFIKPFINKAVDALPVVNLIPKSVTDKDQIDAYYTLLQTAKNKILDAEAQAARSSGDNDYAEYLEKGKKRTLLEINPYADPSEIIRYLPSRYKKYFSTFAKTSDANERKYIVSHIPEYIVPYVEAQWDKQDYIASGDIDGLKQAEQSTRPPADYIDVEAMMDKGILPNKDYVGWAPGVDLNAMKVVASEEHGIDPYEMGLWKDAQAMASNGVIMDYRDYDKQSNDNERLSPADLKAIMEQYGNDVKQLIVTNGSRDKMDINYKDSRKEEVHRLLKHEGMINA